MINKIYDRFQNKLLKKICLNENEKFRILQALKDAIREEYEKINQDQKQNANKTIFRKDKMREHMAAVYRGDLSNVLHPKIKGEK